MDALQDGGQKRRSALDELLVDALAAEWSYSHAAEAVGYSERTVARRMADPTFGRLVADSERRPLLWRPDHPRTVRPLASRPSCTVGSQSPSTGLVP